MKTQRKNKNKLTKRSNKKNKQNKKTQKRKQSGGNNILTRSKATLRSKATSLLTRGMRLNWKKNSEACEDFIKRLIQEYKEQSKKYPPELKNNYVKMKLCIKINKMLNQTDISHDVRKYLNEIHSDTCDKSSQNSMDSNSFLSI